jgi:hypothetical protein
MSRGEVDHGGHGCGCNLLITLRANHEEDKILSLRNDLLHCLEEIKEIALGGTTSTILYNFLFKVIITLRGLDSYTI